MSHSQCLYAQKAQVIVPITSLLSMRVSCVQKVNCALNCALFFLKKKLEGFIKSHEDYNRCLPIL